MYIGNIDNIIDVVHSNDNDSDDFDDEDNSKPIPGLLLDPDTLQFLQQQGIQPPEQVQQRVPAQAIIEGVINDNKITAQVYNGSNDINVYLVPLTVMNPIEILQTPEGTKYKNVTSNEGQIIPPCSTTTIETFLDGNTKYIVFLEYIVQEIFNAYERYRDGKGTKYTINGGGKSKNFGTVLTSLGHTLSRKGKSRVPYVTLKRSSPISNTNPIEALNAIPGNKISIAPALTPEEALNLLKNPIGTPDTNQPTPILEPPKQQNLRCMNKHVDVRNFLEVYLTREAESETDRDNLFLCFGEYCKDKGIVPDRFGKSSLINYFNRYLVKPGETGFIGQVLKGWKCKTDKEEINNAMKEEGFRKLWEWNVVPYMIGWHNGKVNERYDKTMTTQWKNLDVHYRNHEHVRPIPELIEMTKAFEESLPDRVKEIKQRQLQLAFFPYEPTLEKEFRTLILSVRDSLEQGIFTEDSEEHLNLKNRIETLRTEAVRINNEEYQRLEESIKEDKARLRDETAWCIAVRSTFGTGKTFNLKPYIEAFPEMKILIVLPRISLTDDYMREMRELGFELYTDAKFKGIIQGNRIVVCLPSLSKVRGVFDLLVLDEYKASKDLLHKLISKENRKNRITGKFKYKELKCYRALCQHVANTKRVYVADALLTNAHVLEIAAMRKHSDEFNNRVTVYQNMFQKHRGNIVFTVNDQHILIHKIIQFLREGKRVVVPTNSKEFAELLRKKVMDSDLNVTISLTSADEKATAPIQELWNEKQLIIYTPTILAGNSYNSPISVVCGFFTKMSCDQADSLQMLMRSRHNTSKEYYICIDTRPGKSPIPSNIGLSIEAVKEYLLGVKEVDLAGWPAKFYLPVDMIEFNYQKGTFMAKDDFFISCCNYMKQCHVANKEYQFRMLLYMRDAGFRYGGNIYTKTKDKEAIAVIKEETKDFKKERAEAVLDAKYTCEDLTYIEYSEVVNKVNKTKDDSYRLLKYRIKRRYNVDNVPKWLFKLDAKNAKQYAAISIYRELNGITDPKIRNEIISKIDYSRLNIEHEQEIVPNQHGVLTTEIQQATTIYNPAEYIDQIRLKRDITLCEHGLKILEIISATEFLRNVPRFEIPYNEFNNVTTLKDYVTKREKELRELVNDFKIKVDNLASKVTNKAFGIKIKTTPNSYNIENMWIKNPHNLISSSSPALWPYNWDLTDREELRVLIPEPTITEKSKAWTYNVVMRRQVQLSVPTLPKVTPVITLTSQARKPAKAIICKDNLMNLKATAPRISSEVPGLRSRSPIFK